MTSTTVAALAAACRADPGRPLVTFYDSGSGERVELSVATFDNWVNKLGNLFGVELGLEPGDDIVVDLPTSWQACVAVLGAWSVGLVVSLQDDLSPALRLVGPAAVVDNAPGEHVLACSLRPLGGEFDGPLPSGWLDFSIEVPGQADMLLAPVAVSATDEAVRTADGLWSHGDLVERALARAQLIGLSPGGRLLTDINPAVEIGLSTCLAAPLVTGSSVVLLANVAGTDRDRIAEQERVTCVWLPAG